METISRAYAYIRVSSKGQVSGWGMERQSDVISAYAKKAGYRIVKTFREEGISGTADAADRPAFMDMVSAIESGKIQVVIIEGMDRLAREYRIQETLLIYLASRDITLISARTEENVTEAIKGDPVKVALIQIQGVFAQLEKGLLVKKLKAARDKVRAEKGRCEGRYDYRLTPEGQAIYAEARQLRALPSKISNRLRMTYPEIALALNSQGVRTADGLAWTPESVRGLLRISGRKTNHREK